MRRYPKWVLTLGIVAVTPGLATAAGFPFGSDADANSTAAAPKASRNQKVAEDIALALKKAQFHGYEIEIEYKDGVATLSGKVSDPRQKVKANQVVGAVPGVRRLDNRLIVAGAPRGNVRQVAAEAVPGKPSFVALSGRRNKWPSLDASPSRSRACSRFPTSFAPDRCLSRCPSKCRKACAIRGTRWRDTRRLLALR
jgi:hypothetical protein